MTGKTIIWLHADNLHLHSPALQANPGSPAIFVWDERLLAEWQISLKRIVFIYECLLELPVVIRKGDVVQEVSRFAIENHANLILTNASPSPQHRLFCQQIINTLPKGTRLQVLSGEPFVEFDGNLDLKRFSRYWNKVKGRALKR